MIRFSAALVAVAIGVLIGGIATSKLLLVYIAIAVSAVALVALAIGVVLKREELFGEGQGLAPAGAGASPVLPLAPVKVGPRPRPVRTCRPRSRGRRQATAGPPRRRRRRAADLSAARPVAAGQGRSADPAPPWEAQSARDPWSSPVPGMDARRAGAAVSAWRHADRATVRVATRQAGKAPAAWRQAGSVLRRAQAATDGAIGRGPRIAACSPTAPPASRALESGATPRRAGSTGWQPADADSARSPRRDAAPVPGGGSGGRHRARTTDDDWPTRYSWLDDEPDESGEARDAAAGAARPPADEPARTGRHARTAHRPPGGHVRRREPAAASHRRRNAGRHRGRRARKTAEPREVSRPATPRTPTDSARPRSRRRRPSSPAGHGGERRGSRPSRGRAAGGARSGRADTDLVAVVRGVPRYHEPDCVLIRFMPEGDARR